MDLKNSLLVFVVVMLAGCGGGNPSENISNTWIGTKQMGVAGANTFASSVQIDANGNVFVAGKTSGGLDSNMLSGYQDYFFIKFNSSGLKQYTKQMGANGAGVDNVHLAIDSSGNVYIAGDTTGGLDGNTQTGTADFFISKYSSSGDKLYTKQMGVAGVNTFGNAVATDASDNVIVAGATTGGLDGNTLSGTTDLFFTKYNSSGVKQYTKQMGVAGADTQSMSVATDANGNIFVAGWTAGGLDGNALTGTTDLFVTKYNSNGVKQYTKQMGVSGAATSAFSVATDANGNVFIAGWTAGGLDGNTLTGTTDFFVTKYNSNGVKQYTKQMGVVGDFTAAYGIATDASGNVFVAGYTYGGLDGNTLIGNRDFFVVKYSNSGVKQYTKQMGVANDETMAFGDATDSNGNIFVAGWTTGGLDGNTKTGTRDFFVTKFNSNGLKQ